MTRQRKTRRAPKQAPQTPAPLDGVFALLDSAQRSDSPDAADGLWYRLRDAVPFADRIIAGGVFNCNELHKALAAFGRAHEKEYAAREAVVDRLLDHFDDNSPEWDAIVNLRADDQQMAYLLGLVIGLQHGGGRHGGGR